MILFSIIVHEKPLVVENQVKNFIYFNPDCYVILHISAWMKKSEFEEIKNILAPYKNVAINDQRIYSGYGDGTTMKMHVTNFLYAAKHSIPFEYFCLHASNDMFVKKGLDKYIVNYDAGYFLPKYLEKLGWVYLDRAQGDWNLKRMIRTYKLEKIVGGQLEGSFYKKEIMAEVSRRIISGGFYEIPGVYAQGFSRFWTYFFNHRISQMIRKRVVKGFLYPKEELYFITLSQDLIKNRACYNYCYINWKNKLNISVEDIEAIRSGEIHSLQFHVSEENLDNCIMSFFAVKRIDRQINDPIRQYITKLQI